MEGTFFSNVWKITKKYIFTKLYMEEKNTI